MSDFDELKDKVQKAYVEWENNSYLKSLKKKQGDSVNSEEAFDADSRKVLYTPLDADGKEYLSKLGFPGKYPFTRGIQPTMYRGKLWTMRQYSGFGTARESNKRFKYLLSNGTSGLSTAFDLPTQIGYDSDDPISCGEVGKVGVAIDTLADMEILFNEIPLDKISTSMTINSSAAVLLAMYIAVAEKQGVPKNKISGTIQNDILKEYIARGTYIYPPKASMRIITNIFEYCSKEIPAWNTISISGYHIREAGSTASQEVGFTLADGIAYVEAAVNAGLDVEDFAGQLSFFFNSQNDLLEEVAKFRAARRLWAKIMKERFGAKKERSMMLRFHSQTAGSTLTAQQVENNIVRVTIQTLAAVLGGTQSLHTNSKDEALALPTEASVITALRTQQIVAYESGITNTIDPLAGSYYVEALTDKIEKEASDYINKIDALGGMVAAIENGFVQKEIQDAAYKFEKEIESGKRVIVGLNKFVLDEDQKPELLKIDLNTQEEQIKFLKKIKAGRDKDAVNNALTVLKDAAEGNDNIMPAVINAVKVYASVGEICNTMREVFGEFKETIVI
ncbi:MAG: methylmalonyl-CoA mutase family protein [Ignavibacteriaceae bacterium]|nr:methylmalonyl-CoA mutase family protein [Ignavibacteriaceae bacterium]